jgi:transcriptional regulator with XRE-family HTH domain
MDFGRSLRLCRASRGLSQRELAGMSGISVSYLSLLEKNLRDPALSVVEKIASALNVPVSILLFLGTDSGEIRQISPQAHDAIAGAALKLMNAHAD